MRHRAATTIADRLGFMPPAEDEDALRSIRAKSERLSALMSEISSTDRETARRRRGRRAARRAHWLPRQQVERLANDLNQHAAELANATTAKTDDLIARNASSYRARGTSSSASRWGRSSSRLLLGFVLSWSLIGPIQRIDSRLAAIASGDFSGHVDVDNRDELGALGRERQPDERRAQAPLPELEAASRHKSEFLANMSHELRTPLNAIIGFSQVLREQMFGEVNEKQAEYLDDILSSGNHLLSLINDVLDLSKVEAGQVELEVAPFSLREALERGVVMVRERATEDGVQVALAADPEVDVVEGDERRIRQVIFNLLSNAVKFTPAGGRST